VSKKRKRLTDTWRVGGWDTTFFAKVKVGVPLSEVLVAVKKVLPKRFRRNIVGKAVRVMCPQCGSDGEYTGWQFKGPRGGVVYEFHLYKGVEYCIGQYSKREYVSKWEMV
jgi:hypothetical protein